MKTLARVTLLFGAILFLTSASVLAADAKPAAADPDPAANPALAEFMKSGIKAYFMGTRLGLNGWLLIKGNQVQIAYTPLDNQSMIIGALFDVQGNNITTQQIKTLYDTNKEVSATLNSLQVPAAAPTAMSSPAAQPPSTTPAATAAAPMIPASPGDRLVQNLQDASGVSLGAPTAPRLYMVADPNCPHCQATWRALRAAVFGGKLQIRLVPIGAVDPDSDRAAAQFLRSANPLDAWDKYISGDHGQLAGTPDSASLTAVHNNRVLVDSWHVQMTPYMAYRAKDGQVKIIQGEPEKPAAILDDIAP